MSRLVNSICSVSLLLSLASAQAMDLDLNERSSSAVPHAIRVYFTSRGRKLFENKLDRILYLNGYALDDVQFPELDFEAPQPISPRALELSPHAQPHQGGVAAIRDAVKHWLLGIELNDPRPKISLRGAGYHARFTRLAARIDSTAQRITGEREGVSILLEAEAPEFRIQVDSARMVDLANPFLGTFGMNGLSMELAHRSEPLRLQLPLHFTATPEGGASLRALHLRTNLELLKTRSGFERPILFPKVEVIINGHHAQLNPRAVEDEIVNQQESLTAAILGYAKDYAETALPEKLNGVFTQALSGGLEDINQMEPPGAPGAMKPEEKFRFGVGVEDAKLDRTHLSIGLKGFIRDPLAQDSPTHLPEPPETPETKDDDFHLPDADPSGYDVALSVHERFINRVLELSYARGYFDNISTGSSEDDPVLHFATAPAVSAESDADPDHAHLKLTVRQEVTGLAAIAVRSPIEVNFDARIRLKHLESGDTTVLMDGVEESSASIDDRFIRFGIFKAKVMDQIHQMLRDADAKLQREPKILAPKIPLPPALFGVPIVLQDIRIEKNGHFVLFMNYGRLP